MVPAEAADAPADGDGEALATTEGFTPNRDGADQYVRHILENSARVKSNNSLRDHDDLLVPVLDRTLTSSWDGLKNLIDLVTENKASSRDHIYMLFRSVISSANALVVRTQVSKSGIAYAERTQAKAARAARAKNDDAKQMRLRTAILDVETATTAPLADTDKLAGSIRNGVRERLGEPLEETWPSTSTIRRAIKAILQERGEDQGHP